MFNFGGKSPEHIGHMWSRVTRMSKHSAVKFSCCMAASWPSVMKQINALIPSMSLIWDWRVLLVTAISSMSSLPPLLITATSYLLPISSSSSCVDDSLWLDKYLYYSYYPPLNPAKDLRSPISCQISQISRMASSPLLSAHPHRWLDKSGTTMTAHTLRCGYTKN